MFGRRSTNPPTPLVLMMMVMMTTSLGLMSSLAWQPTTTTTRSYSTLLSSSSLPSSSSSTSLQASSWRDEEYGYRGGRRRMGGDESYEGRSFRPYGSSFGINNNNNNRGNNNMNNADTKDHETMGPSTFGYSRARAASFWGHDEKNRGVGTSNSGVLMDRRRRGGGGGAYDDDNDDRRMMMPEQGAPYDRRREQEEQDMMMMMMGRGGGVVGGEQDRRMMEDERRLRMEEERRMQQQQQGGGGGGRWSPQDRRMDPMLNNRRQEQAAVPGASYRRPITNLSFNSEMEDPNMMMMRGNNNINGAYDRRRVNGNFGAERDMVQQRDPFFDDRRMNNDIGDRWSPSSFRPNSLNNNNGYNTAARLYNDRRRDPNVNSNRWNPSTYRSGNAYNPSTRSPQDMMAPQQSLYDNRRMGNKWSPATFRGNNEDGRRPPPPPPMMDNNQFLDDRRRTGVEENRWSPSGFQPHNNYGQDRRSPSWFQPDALGVNAYGGGSSTSQGERPLRPWNPRRSSPTNFWGGSASPSSSSSQYKTGVTEPISSKDFQKGISNQVTIGPESSAERRRRVQKEVGRYNDGSYYDDPYYPQYGGVAGEYGYPPQDDNRMYPQQQARPVMRQY
uniref:Uncharacterized protein n=1 Tax=Amphora coffeiformis TaxID=265554 RepID=A0A7S3P587_9STRA